MVNKDVEITRIGLVAYRMHGIGHIGFTACAITGTFTLSLHCELLVCFAVMI